MAITAALVKELRDTTGAGMMDAKKALTETAGDMEAAVDWLRTKGLAKAAKKSGRTAAEGLVAVKVDGGNVGVAVEVNSETDFVAKNAEFQANGRRCGRCGHGCERHRSAGCGRSWVANRWPTRSPRKSLPLVKTCRCAAWRPSKVKPLSAYVHNAATAGMGKIGVLVALKGGDEGVRQAGCNAHCGHQPCRPERSRAGPGCRRKRKARFRSTSPVKAASPSR